jgi:peptidoglycan hydrolase-like protein with peptidoglycan-binding domain
MRHIVSAIALAAFSVWACVAAAQSTFIQIEAHDDLETAQARARDFAGVLPNVNGFRLGTGWYAIALGPYADDAAIGQLQTLRAQRRVPADSFLTESAAFSQQFYPIGGNALTAAPVTAPATDQQTETAAVEAPVVEAPVVVAPPRDETPAEAQRSERELTRDERADLQIALQFYGFYDGRIDASFGRGTRASMAAWQADKGYEPTGILTTRQRAALMTEYKAVFASIGMAPLRDEVAGIAMDLPLAMVGFDRYDPPFAHYTPRNDSGVTVLLISQTGDEATLLGLYDIMQTLEIVPLQGERSRSRERFTLTGENARIKSHTYAVLADGTVKGFTLIWPAGQDRRFDIAREAMRDSFAPIDGQVLPDAYGDGALEQDIDLISGLQIRKPLTSRSGFFIDARGSVLTSDQTVQGCGRITLDETYEVEVVARDEALGLALLRPKTPLAPMDYARFQGSVPRLQSEVAVAGYSYEGMLSAPTMTFGTLADVKGLTGEENVKRLALVASPGDAGGPVFDTSGSVLGMLLPPAMGSDKQLPDDVSFATDAAAIAIFLSNSGYTPAASDRAEALSPEDLTRVGANMTVLVSCWQ